MILSLLSLFFIKSIRFYQLFLSPFFPRKCCFYPTCSQYALLALKSQGLIKGVFLTCFRLLRCHPWSLGGIDFPSRKTKDWSFK